MLRIEVKKGNINRALKELRYKFRNTKRLQRLKELKYFEKPSAKRRLQLEKAIRNDIKRREED
tara:strand:- start:513 stop:701 length:189 start_codon:yes stop_codon:yes gene_type:complete